MPNPQEWYIEGKKLPSEELYAYFEEGLNKTPEFLPWAWCGMGLSMYHKRKYGLAKMHCEKAIALDANLAVAWNLMGLLQQSTGDIEGARNSFEKGLKLAPDSVAAQNNLININKRPDPFLDPKKYHEQSMKRRGFILIFTAIGWAIGWLAVSLDSMVSEIARLMAKGWGYIEAIYQGLLMGGFFWNVAIILILLIAGLRYFWKASLPITKSPDSG